MKIIVVVLSKFPAWLLLVTVGILWSSQLYSADGLPELSVKFQKSGLSVYGRSVVNAKDGGFLLAGGVRDVEGPHTWGWLAKVDHKGNREWQKELGKKAQDSTFNSAVITPQGDALLAGSVHGEYESGLEQALAWVVKVNQDGKVLWDKVPIVGGRAARAVDIKLLDANSVLVLITAKQDLKDYISVLKFNQVGNEIFKKEVSLPDSVIGKFIYPLPDNGFIVSGIRFSPPDFQNKVWIARFSEHGDLLWDQTLLDKRGKPLAGVVLPNNDILLARLESFGEGSRGAQLSLIRVAEGGNVMWNKRVSTSEICGISTLWLSGKGKTLATGANCDTEKTRVWIGEVLGNGEINILEKIISISRAGIVNALPLDKKIALILENETGLGDAPTWLLVGSMSEIE